MSQTFDAEILVPGTGSGNVLVLPEPLSLWGGLDPHSGKIIDHRHPCSGEYVSGRVVFMTGSRGSSSASSILLEAVRAGTAPAAIVLLERDGILSLGAAVAREMYGMTPPVVILDLDDHTQFHNGEYAEVLCENGTSASVIRSTATTSKN